MRGGPEGIRGSDPRFHVGWQYLKDLISEDSLNLDLQGKLSNELEEKKTSIINHISIMGDLGNILISNIRKKLNDVGQHPKVKTVVEDVVRRVVEEQEKVVIFCHHIATMHEVFGALKDKIKVSAITRKTSKKDRIIWEGAWNSLLKADKNIDSKIKSAILSCVVRSPFRRQVMSWLPEKPKDEIDLKHALKNTPLRNIIARKKLPSIYKTVQDMAIKNPTIFDKNKWAWPSAVTTATSDEQIALFNTPFGPDILVATDRLSEGIDLHKCCRLMVHYEFDPSPVRIRQREGRIRRIKGWAQAINKPIEYAKPIYANTRDEQLVKIVESRLVRFDLLLGGAPKVDIDNDACKTPNSGLLEKLCKRIGTNNINDCLAIPKPKGKSA